MNIKDIRPIKNALRKQYKEWRRSLPAAEKQRMDEAIADRLQAMPEYRDCRVLLIYVSTPIEVDTRALITRALEDGKTIAVPRCINNTREMDFYTIKSLADLESGSFGVDEPNPERAEKLTALESGLCIVPALAFDKLGYRLGYGKGYYDRFLCRFGGTVMGICYDACITDALPHGRFDRSAEAVITQTSVIRV